MTEKDKKQLIVVIVGVVILAFVMLNSKKGGNTNSYSSGGGGIPNMATIASDVSAFDENMQLIASVEVSDAIAKLLADVKSWDRNPFEFLVSTEPEKVIEESEEGLSNIPSFKINGIIYDDIPTDSSVVIDGEFYQESEIVDGWLIVSIEEENVIFQKGDIEYIFYLYEEE